MKRILTILTAALLILALCTACGDTAKNVDLKALMDEINPTYNLTGLKAVEDTASLNRYYQIEEAGVKQFAAELTSSGSNYNEVVLIEAVDSAAAESIKAKLDERLRSQLSNAKSYDAEQVSMIEGCSVKVNGNFVYLIVGDQHADIEATVEAALK